jgi:hypothetical protein
MRKIDKIEVCFDKKGSRIEPQEESVKNLEAMQDAGVDAAVGAIA